MKKKMILGSLVLLTAFFLFLPAGKAEAAVKQTGATTTGVTFTWDANLHTGNTNYQDLYYEVSWGPSASQITKTAQCGLTSTTNSLIECTPGCQYYVKVELVYQFMNSATPGRYSCGSTTCYTKPGKVTKFGKYDFGSGQKGLRTSWTPVSGDASIRYQYEIRNSSNKLIQKGEEYTNTLSLSTYKGYNTAAKLRVRPYIKSFYNDTTYYGAWSSYKKIVPQPILKSAKLVDGKKVKISWGKVKGATKYIIYMSTKKDSGFKKIATVSSSKTTYTISSFKGKSFEKYKDYYYKVVTQTKKLGNSPQSYGNSFYIYTTYK